MAKQTKLFDPDKAYTVGVWDMPMYVYDHDEDDYVRNEDGTVALFNLPHYDYSYIGDDADVDTLELRDKGDTYDNARTD